MPVQAMTQTDPNLFFKPPSTDVTGLQRLNTQVGGVAVSNDFSGRLSVRTAEGDTITLTADLEYDFRAVNYASQFTADGSTVDLQATYAGSTLKKEFGVTVEGELNEQELNDLEKLFRKVSNIFRSFFHGKDEAGLAKTAKLAERLGQLPSLSGLDLNVDIQRSVTVLAAQIASEVTDRPSLPTGRESQVSVATSSAVTPGGAPAVEAAISSSSTKGNVPATSSTAASVADATDGIRFGAPAQDLQRLSSLAQQVLDSLRDARAETRTIRKYLPDFLEKLHEDLVKELRAEREHQSNDQDQPPNQAQTPAESSAGAVFSYHSVSQTSVLLSIRS